MKTERSTKLLTHVSVVDDRDSIFLCKCGNYKQIRRSHVDAGATKSCGCGESMGELRSGAYVSWKCMRSRCLYIHDISYSSYGGRGITIDPAWDDFLQFKADMGARPLNHTLDRIDPDGNYTPSNCRWAPPQVQTANRRPRLESAIQESVKRQMEADGWLVEVISCGPYMRGIPDLFCFHPSYGIRWVDVKRPKGSKLTTHQIVKWTKWTSLGIHVWIVTSEDYSALFHEPNWLDWWKPSYDKILSVYGPKPAHEILREMDRE